MSAPQLDPRELLAATRCELTEARIRAVQVSRRLDLAVRRGLPLSRLRELDGERLARKRELAELEHRVRDLEAQLAAPRAEKASPDAA